MSDNEFIDFDAAIAESEGHRVRFRLGGEEFAAHPGFAGPSLRLAAAGEGGPEAPIVVGKFIRDQLDEDDHERWAAALERAPLWVLNDVVERIIEAGSGRPTKRPSASPVRPLLTGQTSKAVSSLPATAASSTR